MTADETDKSLRDAIKRSLRTHANLRRSLQIGAAAATAVAGILAVFGDKSAPIVLTQALLLLFALGVTILLLIADDTTPDLVENGHRLKDERDAARRDLAETNALVDELDDELAYAANLYETNRALSEIIDPMFNGGDELTPEKQDARILRLLDVMVERKKTLFDMDDERWTFAVYSWDGAANVLKCRATRRWSRESEEQPHREWPSGVGHVGIAFQNQEELVCEDAQDPNVAGFLKAPPHLYREYDPDLYRSLASLPIMIGDRKGPLGVLVATSDVVERFGHAEEGSRDGVEPLRALANVLATLLQLPHLKASLDKIPGEGT